LSRNIYAKHISILIQDYSYISGLTIPTEDIDSFWTPKGYYYHHITESNRTIRTYDTCQTIDEYIKSGTFRYDEEVCQHYLILEVN
jgi:hypothetical protein